MKLTEQQQQYLLAQAQFLIEYQHPGKAIPLLQLTLLENPEWSLANKLLLRAYWASKRFKSCFHLAEKLLQQPELTLQEKYQVGLIQCRALVATNHVAAAKTRYQKLKKILEDSHAS
ncbi:hypothetical protein H0A36_09980 [Endozoicomonas sp. SM1973]|uniref:Uncharacterized protein n=1 Tax=Spartinivicinus marinus TaxID=2994442 RepID=A0A853I145_9GAMM|nr:hypothetical protein [Spartinivicinus marinus]MCX4024636.1 hypothetical protein [Spartinivicinus marinus]NYZ66339.1 hypothetical protein [Spartinivicinus marinus]